MRERTKDLRGLGLALVVAGISAPACGQTSHDDSADATGGAGSSTLGGSAGSSATDGRSGGSSGVAGTSTETGGAPAGSSAGGVAGRNGAGESTGGLATGYPGRAGGGAGGSAGRAAEGDEAGTAGASDASGMGGEAGMGGLCSAALPLKCGDRWNHSTLDDGQPNRWFGYGLTARAESGRETVYAFDTASDCNVEANLKNLTTDLDLLLLSSCDPGSNVKAASTPIDLQTVETVSWTSPAGKTFYVVVDGYGGADGSYTLEIDCTCN